MKIRLVPLTLLFLACSGCLGPSAPDLVVSDGFPVGTVTYPGREHFHPDDAPPPSFTVRWRNENYTSNGGILFNTTGFGTVLLRAERAWTNDLQGIRYNVTFERAACAARITVGNSTKTVVGSFEGILTAAAPRIEIHANRPCRADFSMRYLGD